MSDRVIDLADVEYVPASVIIEKMFKKYKWEDNEKYFKRRLDELLELLDKKYNLELAEEKQGLYFINDFYVRFM